jgi:hypothetical protein
MARGVSRGLVRFCRAAACRRAVTTITSTARRHGDERRPYKILAIAICAVAIALTARAHTPETSYCKVDIKPELVEFAFSFDLATLRQITPIDTNHDGRIVPEELAAAAPALEAFLRRTVYLELNEREASFGAFSPPEWPPDAKKAIVQADWGQRLITLVFRNPVLHAPDSVAITFDFFETLGERHTVLGKFLWNGGENSVIFTRFEPDYLFDTGYKVPAWDQFLEYLQLGISHIFLGYDHIAFLLALFFVRRFVALLKIITAFTVAHTITLALAALGVVSLPSRLVESAIAISIIYVAAENLWRHNDAERGEHRWRITFAFGLVHGFGFAAVLRELGLPSQGLVRSLLGFNLGVELGQLAIAAVCWPILVWVGRRTWAARVRVGVSCVLLAFGLAWLVERAFALKFLPI